MVLEHLLQDPKFINDIHAWLFGIFCQSTHKGLINASQTF